MKNYSYFVNKSFKVNKKRNILTITGIIASIILIVTVGYISNYVRDVDIARAKQTSGNYEAVLRDRPISEIDKIIHNVKVKQYGIYRLDYETKVKIGDGEKTLSINALDNVAMEEMFKPLLSISEGRIPSEPSEVALIYSAKKALGKNIGDILQLGNKEYRIVGFYEDESEHSLFKLTGVTCLDIRDVNGTVNVLINVKYDRNKVKHIEEIASLVGINSEKKKVDKLYINASLFYAYGTNLRDNKIVVNGEDSSLLIINLTILLLTVFFIYGSINVSLKERTQQFATLRCIGATPSKIRYLIAKESFLLGILSIPIGIILGQLLSWVITEIGFTKIIGIKNYGVGISIYWSTILTAVIFTAVTIMLATIVPLLKSNKISPIQGVKAEVLSSGNIKIRKSKLIQRLFGYKGHLAFKNIAANNKSFLIITASLTMLLIVFTSFGGYYLFSKKQFDFEKERSFDIASIYSYFNSVEDKKLRASDMIMKGNNIKEEIEALGVTKDITMEARFRVKFDINGFKLNPKAKIEGVNDYSLSKKGDRSSLENWAINFVVYDDNLINKILPYINKGKGVNDDITLEDFNNNGFIVMNVGYGNDVPPFLLNNKDEVLLYPYSKKENLIKANYLGSIELRSLYSGKNMAQSEGLTLIVSEDFYYKNKELIDSDYFDMAYLNINLNIKDNLDKRSVKTSLQQIISLNGGHFLEEKIDIEEFKNMLDAMLLLIYTTLFLALIIGAINIINTRSINIMLRKKEFGTLLAVGIARENLKKIIVLEGIVQWFISASIGTVLSLIILEVINVLMYYFNDSEMYSMPIWLILIGIVILLIINLLSSILAYKKLKNLSVSELLRNEE